MTKRSMENCQLSVARCQLLVLSGGAARSSPPSKGGEKARLRRVHPQSSILQPHALAWLPIILTLKHLAIGATNPLHSSEPKMGGSIPSRPLLTMKPLFAAALILVSAFFSGCKTESLWADSQA